MFHSLILLLVHLGRAFLCDGGDYAVADYPKIWAKIENAANLVPQAQINADPKANAANYGISADGLRFSVPNYTLRPHLAAAGVFGSAGTTVEDQIQNIIGSLLALSDYNSNFPAVTGGTGAFNANSYGAPMSSINDIVATTQPTRVLSFDAARVARTGHYTGTTLHSSISILYTESLHERISNLIYYIT